jgi:hypothetical protein
MKQIALVSWPAVPEKPYIVIVDVLFHTSDYPFCNSIDCPCHEDEELMAELGDALMDGRVSERDAGAVRYGEKPIRPRVA